VKLRFEEDTMSKASRSETHTRLKIVTGQTSPKPELSAPEPFSSLVTVDLAGLSHPGLVRPDNQDHFLIVRGGRALETVCSNLAEVSPGVIFDETVYAMVIADGLGGYAAGEVASRRAIYYLLSMVLHTPDWILRRGPTKGSEVMERMADRFRSVNAALLREAAAQASLNGMSTTMTAAVTLGDDLIVTHVGDSRAYLYRGGALQRLTRDHSLADRLLREGVKAPTDRLSRELRGILLQALGAKDTLCKPEVNHFVLNDGDCLLLCTDGLTNQVDDSVIADVLRKNMSAADSCQALIDLSLKNGGLDNATVLIGRYSIPSRGHSPLYYTGPKRTHH